ncbi:carboxymuconolactone decarboxylase family protein [Asticcacaulis taihuensis]|uniref:carboxymuconolactone decarboxylase family protein n=1 Tax=Asticcacaulis taihuensis TaxID=260084 RepID=UPI0026EEA835|nr:carboxymuconolactone decarboxylase family protein [Asticcacaulis taihuensis]
MSIETLQSLIPAYARDLSSNLTNLLNETIVNDQQKWGTFLSCAHAVGVPAVVKNIEAAAGEVMASEAMTAAKAAAAIMGLNNVYFRALHLMQNKEYEKMRAGLRMNILTNPGVDKVDFELWSLAVSAVNACGLCMDSHEKVLRNHGVTAVQIQAALRIASTVNAISAVLRAEAALASR